MKNPLTLPAVAVLFAGVLLTGVVRAEDAKPEAPKKTAAKTGDELHALMKKMGKDFGPLAKSVGDESKIEANRATAKDLVALAEKCATLVPSSAEKVPAADREKFVAGYKGEIAKLAGAFRKIDAALEKKDFAAAKAAVGEAGALKKEDHPKYIIKKK